jgi:hypothetical protein
MTILQCLSVLFQTEQEDQRRRRSDRVRRWILTIPWSALAATDSQPGMLGLKEGRIWSTRATYAQCASMFVMNGLVMSNRDVMLCKDLGSLNRFEECS